MRSLVKWAIRNSPAMNTLLIAAMIVGAVSMIVMRREVFPNFSLEILLVSVPFPGATPEETEEGICQKIESAVSGVEGVKKITSVAQEGFGYVILELNSDVGDVQKVLEDVDSQIKQISSFPPDTEKPSTQQIVFRAPAISIGIIGPEYEPEHKLEQELELRALAEEIRSEILDLPAAPPGNPFRYPFKSLFQPKGAAISGADISNEKPYQITVQVSEDSLREFGISLQSLAQILKRHNTEIPGGTLKTPSQEVLLRGNQTKEVGEEIAKIPLVTKPNGDVITVGDVGQVVDGFAETTSVNLINGRPGIVLGVSKTNQEDLFTIVETVKKYIAQKKLPVGYEIKTWNDVSLDVKDRIDLLTRNGIQGLILVFIVLALFLELRLAFWVAMGIPVSILGAGFVLLITGQTLNMLTMFAFLMALGIVVDDAIVIGENIYSKREEGMKFFRAAIEGTVEVIPSVTASVTTTILAFLPLMYVTGVMGKFIAVMPVAVIAMLAISLVESIIILPCHLAHHDNLFLRIVGLVLYVFKPFVAVIGFLNARATRVLDWVINRLYAPFLSWALSNKPIVLSGVLALFMVAIGLVVAGIAPFAFFPKLDGRDVTATVAFPNGTSVEFSREATGKLVDAIKEIDKEYEDSYGSSFIVNLNQSIGEIGDAGRGPAGITNGSHVGSVNIQLTQPGDRFITTRDIINKWRDRVPKIAGTEALKFNTRSMGPGGQAIELKLLADDNSVEYLEQAADEIKAYLAGKKGVFDIEDDQREGKTEQIFKLNEQGRALGLDETAISSTLRAIYFGEEVQRLQRGRHEVKLMVQYPEEDRKKIETVDEIRIRDSQGIERPLGEVAVCEFKKAYSKINRLNQRRSITITADADKSKGGDPVKIIAEMRETAIPEIIQKYKDEYGANLSVNWEGEQAQTMESMNSMFVGFGIAMLAIFIVLTLEFRSYIQPMIILAIIPFGWLGAILGHAILRLDLTLFSFFGLIALTGVVINDSIVLVDFINRQIRSGVPLKKALVVAGTRRFRPILLTSMTTVAGLVPMLMETSVQAQVLIPMAASLIFGLVTGTFLILVLVPIFYQIYGNTLGFFDVPLVENDEAEDYDEDTAETNQETDNEFGPQTPVLGNA